MLKHLIDDYYQYRGYVDPNAKQALLFLISEVGELTEAYLNTVYTPETIKTELSQDELRAFRLAEIAGDHSDRAVSGQDNWVRNNDRAKSPNVPFEVADVLMMLDRFALAMGLSEPGECLATKFKSKGFEPERY